MKSLPKLLGFLGGAFMGVLIAAIFMEMNRMDKGPIPGLVGMILGAICWKIVAWAIDRKE
jgi:ABC-type enterobactin transport system permease subunit